MLLHGAETKNKCEKSRVMLLQDEKLSDWLQSVADEDDWSRTFKIYEDQRYLAWSRFHDSTMLPTDISMKF